jgi:exopolysaccharide biosynthesis polyprenyl glycosylphosphotransferase
MPDARRFRTLYALGLYLADSALIAGAFYAAYYLRRAIPWPNEALELPARFWPYWPVWVIYVLSLGLVFFLLRLYHLVRATSRVDEFYSVIGGAFLGTLLAVAVSVLTLKNSIFEITVPRVMLFYAWILSTVLVVAGRWGMHRARLLLQTRNFTRDRVVIIGAGEMAHLVIQKIQTSPYLGYHLLGIVDDDPAPRAMDGFPRLGKLEALPKLIDDYAVDEVIIAKPEADDEALVRLITLAHRDRVNIKVFPDVFQIMAAGVTIDDLGGLPLLSVRDVALRGWKLTMKRAMDVVGSAMGLILLSPVLLLVAILIKLESPGPVFFVQERMGLDAQPFPMIKFRSMRIDSESRGPGWTVKDDPRRTRIGAFIRKYSIDELPQMINIFIGDMSIVGPRPEQPTFVEQFRKMIPRYMERHREKAGLTGWAQVNGLRGDTSVMERTKYDLWYIENWSIWLDVKIIIRTAFKIFLDHNAY